MSDKILTVIVPSYNMEKYLPRCLGSLVVAPELMEKLEVIVVNDGSKDRTSEVAHEFKAKYPQTFKVIDKSNGNYGSCINVAIPIASGMYVKVVDADDYAETATLARSIEVLSREAKKGAEAADLLVTQYDQVDEKGMVATTFDFGIATEGYYSLDDVSASMPRFTIHAIAYKTENLRKINYLQTEGISYTDSEWIVEPMVMVKAFYYLPLVGVHYLLGRAGQTMEDATFARRFQQVTDVSKNIILRYTHLKSIAKPTAVGYYSRQVQAMISMVYGCALFGWHYKPVICDLVEFDAFIKRVPELYDFAAQIEIASRLYTFRYVAEWRRKYSKGTLKFSLFALHQLVVRLRRSISIEWLKRAKG